MLGMKTISTRGTHGARGAGAGLVAVAAAAVVGLGGCGSSEPIVEGLLKVHVTHDYLGLGREEYDAEGVGVRYCRNGVDTVLHASCMVSGYTDASGGAAVPVPVGEWWIAYTVWDGIWSETQYCSYESEEKIYGWLEKVDFTAGDVLDLTGSNRVICDDYERVGEYGMDGWRHRDWTGGAGGGVAPQPSWAPDSG